MRSSQSKGRRSAYFWVGVGVFLAIVVESWRRYSEATGSGEGSATTTFAMAIVLGFPTTSAVTAVIELFHPVLSKLPGMTAYTLLLFGIILNWIFIGALVHRWRRHQLGKHHVSDDVGAETTATQVASRRL